MALRRDCTRTLTVTRLRNPREGNDDVDAATGIEGT